MDITFRNLDDCQGNLKKLLAAITDLPVCDDNKEDILLLLDKMEKEDIEIVKRMRAYEELESKKKLGNAPDQIEKAVLEIMAAMDEVEGEFSTDIATLRERFEKGEEDEDDILVESTTYSKKDPITKEDIKDPVKNKRCGHVYDRASVIDFIQMNRQMKMAVYQCPVQGCNNKVNLAVNDLIDFPQFFKYCK